MPLALDATPGDTSCVFGISCFAQTLLEYVARSYVREYVLLTTLLATIGAHRRNLLWSPEMRDAYWRSLHVARIELKGSAGAR